MPELILPAPSVRDSFLAGERAVCAADGRSPPAWLDEAEADFGAFAASRAVTQQLWGVPVTELWYAQGSAYLGTVMIRHELTAQLRHDGGNIGYHVVPAYRRKGHATAMLAGACAWCRAHGMSEVLLTCVADNIGSRRVIEANGGVLADDSGGIGRYWIAV